MANEFKVKNGVIAPALFNTVNNDLAISASGTGKLKLNGLNWPAADGTADYVLQTDGAGNLSWAQQTGGGGGGATASMVSQDFSGTGSQTNFTLSNTPVDINYTLVQIDGVLQNRTSAYTVTGNTLTFTEAPASGAAIEVTTLISGNLTGVAAGGTLNQVLTKASATDYDTAWSSGLTLTTLTASGQISSTVSTGTAPLVITSTTRVSNLNVATAGFADTAGSANAVTWTNVSGKPSFATVATTGSYLDLSNTPDILSTVATATGDIHGIVDRTASTVSFNEGTRVLTVTPVSGSWTYYHTGTLITVSTTKTITVSVTDGAKFIYIDANATLQEHAVPDFATNVYIAYVYWNNTAARAVIVGDERHGSKRDTTWHSNQHLNVGTVWRSGGDLTYTLNNDAAVQFAVGTPTVIADEDLLHTITHSASPTNNFEQILTGAASLEVIYLSGTVYTTTVTNTTPWLQSSNVAQYNLINTGSGSLSTATEGKYITYWLVATNDMRAGRGPIKLVLGRQLNDTVDQAYAESFTEYGLSFAEQVFMYQIVVQYSSAYTNNAARIRVAGVRKILAKLATTSVASSPASSHSALTGRSDTDSHPISAVTNLQTTLDGKQASLVSGTNIKTVNSVSLLGSGNIQIDPVTYTFGGTGTPATGTALTPYLRAMHAGTSVSASLVAKTVPSGGSFVVSILRSSNGGTTFPDTITTLTLTTGNRVVTTTPTTALAAGDLLRLDISSVNGASDWTVQLKVA